MLDVCGQRIVCELGPDNYYAPGYFSPAPRFQRFYRKSSLGHNVVSVGGLPQRSYAPSAELLGHAAPTHAAAGPGALDLSLNVTSSYEGGSRAAGLLGQTRSWSFRPGASGGGGDSLAPLLTLADSFLWRADSRAPNVSVAMHTFGEVQLLDGRTARISVGGEAVILRILLSHSHCRGVHLTCAAVRLQPPQLPTLGLTRIRAIAMQPAERGCSRIVTAIWREDRSEEFNASLARGCDPAVSW